MKSILFSCLVLCFGLVSCGDASQSESKAVKNKPTSSPELIEKGKACGDVPTSIGLNFNSGYWHIASGFNVDSLGDFRAYDGTWLQMLPTHELVWGNKEEELGRGAWGWNEENEYLSFLSEPAKDFFIGEWQTTNKGDVYVCFGNTPNNQRSTQFKIVRRQSKIVTE